MAPLSEMQGTEMCLHLSYIQRNLFYTAVGIDWKSEGTNFSQNVSLALPCALAWSHLNSVTFTCGGWAWKYLRACFQAHMASKHSSVHHGMGA
jgi:hypothetical protein